jgi:hypothetical protein
MQLAEETSGGFGPIMQLGYVVEDVRQAALEWAQRVGAGPFYLVERQVLEPFQYRGVPGRMELDLAFGYWGGVQVELVQPLGEADTPHHQALRAAPGRLDHCACVVADIEGLLERRGLRGRVLQSGQMPSGLRFVYLERYLPGGLHLELIQAERRSLAAFEGMQAVSRGWDGREPLREIGRLQVDLAGLAARA